MNGSVVHNHVGMSSGSGSHRGSRLTPVATRPPRFRSEVHRGGRKGKKRSRVGHAFLLHMLISGSSSPSRTAASGPRAVVLEDEQSPRAGTGALNGVTEDWSGGGSSRDWDGQEVNDSTGRFTAIAGLLAVAGAGYFCTQVVGTLMNRRSDLARIVPHPVAFSSSASSSSTPTPRASIDTEEASYLRSRPLSRGSLDSSRASIYHDQSSASPLYHDRSTSPIASPRIHRSTSIGELGRSEGVNEAIDEDDAISLTSAASSIQASEVDSLMDSSIDGELPDATQFRSITPAILEKLPYEYTVATLKARGQLAMRAASAATSAAQKASELSAAASTAARTAARASRQAMAAASLAHSALESNDLEKMTKAQMEAWKAAQLAAEAERRAATAAVLATAYEDHAIQQSKAAQELAVLAPQGLRAISHRIRSILKPVVTPIVEITTGIYQWIVDAWMYFASGTFFSQVWSLSVNCVTFVQGVFMAVYMAIRNAVLYVISSISSFCEKTYTGAKTGVSSTYTNLKTFFSKLFNLKGSIGGSTTA